jgi:hypothetical protein
MNSRFLTLITCSLATLGATAVAADNPQADPLYRIGQFTMVWREKDGTWQVTRVMSYDHREEMVPPK